MSSQRTQPTIGDVVDLARQFALDDEASSSSLRHRDRAIGRDLVDLEVRPLAQLLAWLDRVRTERGDHLGERVTMLQRLGLVLLSLAGLAAGWGAAVVVFRYDGTHPVNVIHVMAVFVLLPLITLVGFGLGQLPSRWVRRVPGLGALQDAAGLISPGRLQRFLARRLPQAQRDTLASLVGRGEAHRRLYGRVDRWVVVHSSQVFALGFTVGALVSALYLVVFSDLAFAWSTTLTATATELQRLTDILSSPWAWAWPDARPSAELVAETRYFRLGDGSFPRAQSPAGLGGWWPFLVVCLAVYGVLPRLLTLILAQWRLRVALRRSALQLPGVAELRDRLNTELVETQAEGPEPADAVTGAPAELAEAGNLSGHAVQVIDWAQTSADREAAAAWLATAFGLRVGGWHAAGGARTLADDTAACASACAAGGDLIVMVKAWEPPMGELLDFLRSLRVKAGNDRAVHVLPVDVGEAGALTAPTSRQISVWRSRLASLGDPWLRLAQPEAGES